MAPRIEISRLDRVNAIFMAALLLSLGLHVLILSLLPGAPSDENKPPVELSVELQPPPKPLPPPAPKPPEPEKPKPQPKKPLPQPKPLPPPMPRAETPPPPLHEPEPQPAPPPVISPPPQSAETPPEVVVPPPPPEPPKPKGPSEQDLDASRNNYSTLLSREFAKHKQYPRLAQMRGWQGTAKVELHIDAGGNILSLGIHTSSGFEILDKQALEMVRKASPLPLPPEALRGREFTIVVPVAFRLE